MLQALSSLRYRFFLALGGVLLIALLALAVIAQQLVVPALLAKESEYASSELDRAMRAIDNELKHLSLLAKDWATWDDSHAFMQGQAEDYLDANLAEGLVFEDANLRMVAYLNTDTTPYRIAGIDPENDAFTSCSDVSDDCTWTAPVVASIQAHITEGQVSTNSWLLAAPEQALVSVWPIVRSNGDGPLVGWLAMVRTMNEQWLEQLEEGTGLALSIDSISRSSADLPYPEIVRHDARTMTAIRSIAASPSGYALRLRADLPRQSFKANLETFRFALYWTIGLLIVVVIVVLALLEYMILSPLRQLAACTQRVQEDDDACTPPTLLSRSDEIGTLARDFQQLLEHQHRQTAQLRKLSQHDPLTGLANRRLFDEHLTDMLERTARTAQPLSLLMIDIDHFKAYNDHYGHPAGDECLKAIADTMREQFDQPHQLVARTGGEEFMIVLPMTTAQASAQQAENLRLAIESLACPHAASTVSSVVTASIGIAQSTPEERHDAELLIHAADSALYRAKQAGRNRISINGLSTLA